MHSKLMKVFFSAAVPMPPRASQASLAPGKKTSKPSASDAPALKRSKTSSKRDLLKEVINYQTGLWTGYDCIYI